MPGKHNERQEALVDRGEELGPDAPLVYLGMPLSQLPRERREAVEALEFIVNQAIIDQTHRDPEPWPLRVHSPVKLSAPWRENGRTPEQVYQLNSGKIELEADAVIVIADKGGSPGIGQELAWACALSLPILIVHCDGTEVSRQVKGAADQYDITIECYRDPDDLHDIVGRWLVSRKRLICDGPRRRTGLRLALSNSFSRFARAWESAGPDERDHVVATTQISASRIERILTDPLHLGGASVHELFLLGAALRIEASNALLAKPLPDLRKGQREALNAASQEFGWGFEKTLRVYKLARRELARGGVRRLPLASIQDWADFSERYDC
ncbi:MAG TPA: hypothetical protein VFJ65_01855 [Solirubrobacterales bacterium]|nr:hypothetical protein [Solirubrobacterales bacterium]